LPVPSLEAAIGLARIAIADGERRSTAARRVAKETGVNRRDLYEALIDR
jgi:DNA-binding phage protein